MQTELGDLFHRTRTSLGYALQELARRIGYRNLNKGARRLEHLERDDLAARGLRASVDLKARIVTPRAGDVQADLVEWFRGEIDDVLTELLHRRWRLAKR